jgi:hypothetical protein
MKTLLILMPVLFLIECSSDQKQLDIPELSGDVDEVILPDSVGSLEIPVKIKYSASGCYTFKRLEIKEIESGVLSMKFFIHNPSYHRNDVACTMAIYKNETSQVIKSPAKGNYTLLFNQGKLIKKIKVQ